MRTFSTLISWLFHPLLIPSIAVLVFAIINPTWLSHLDSKQQLSVYVTIVMNSFLFPSISLFLMWRLGMISSLTLEDRQQRIIPYIAVSLFYFWTYNVVRSIQLGEVINILFLSASISVFLLFFINLFYKVSIHTASFSLIICFFILLATRSDIDFSPVIFVSLFLGGTIGSARLVLKVHSLQEVMAGYLVGLIAFGTTFLFI